jgi:hypothetical protein
MSEMDVLYQFAVDCATHKYNRSCSEECYRCPSNISLYTDDRKAAVMIQHSANIAVQNRLNATRQIELDLDKERRIKKWQRRAIDISDWPIWGVLKVAAIILAIMVVYQFLTDKKPDTTYTVSPPVEVVEPAPVVVKQSEPVKPTIIKPVPMATDPLPLIRETLSRIYSVDMNSNGRVDCVDYTLQFYQYYPDRSKVRIMYNHNLKTDWAHLFVRVDGIDIEPGAYLRKSNTEKWFGMQKFWGDVYAPRYDVDMTFAIDKIRNGEIWFN